jgi:signal recognition particle receptor subunit beta
MALYDVNRREIVIRVVYDGPPGAGKTTNLHTLLGCLPPRVLRRFQASEPIGARTQVFDWLELPRLTVKDGSRDVRCQILSVPGQEEFSFRRKMILATADAIVFVCGSQPSDMDVSKKMLVDLVRCIPAAERKSAPLGFVLQANKQDVPGALAPRDIAAALKMPSAVPAYAARATTGEGVYDTLWMAIRLATHRARLLISQGTITRETGMIEEAQDFYERVLMAERAKTKSRVERRALSDFEEALRQYERDNPPEPQGFEIEDTDDSRREPSVARSASPSWQEPDSSFSMTDPEPEPESSEADEESFAEKFDEPAEEPTPAESIAEADPSATEELATEPKPVEAATSESTVQESPAQVDEATEPALADTLVETEAESETEDDEVPAILSRAEVEEAKVEEEAPPRPSSIEAQQSPSVSERVQVREPVVQNGRNALPDTPSNAALLAALLAEGDDNDAGTHLLDDRDEVEVDSESGPNVFAIQDDEEPEYRPGISRAGMTNPILSGGSSSSIKRWTPPPPSSSPSVVDRESQAQPARLEDAIFQDTVHGRAHDQDTQAADTPAASPRAREEALADEDVTDEVATIGDRDSIDETPTVQYPEPTALAVEPTEPEAEPIAQAMAESGTAAEPEPVAVPEAIESAAVEAEETPVPAAAPVPEPTSTPTLDVDLENLPPLPASVPEAGNAWPPVTARGILTRMVATEIDPDRPHWQYNSEDRVEFLGKPGWRLLTRLEAWRYPDRAAGRTALMPLVRQLVRIESVLPNGKVLVLVPSDEAYRIWEITPERASVADRYRELHAAGRRSDLLRLTHDAEEAAARLATLARDANLGLDLRPESIAITDMGPEYLGTVYPADARVSTLEAFRVAMSHLAANPNAAKAATPAIWV